MLAGAQRVHAVDELHEVAGVHDAAVWAEIARAVLDETARQEDAREVLGVTHIHGYVFESFRSML